MPENQKKVMLIEDDHFLSSLLKARLEEDHFAVAQAFDGEEAIQMLKQDRPDIIILDLIMPKATGFEVMQSLAATPGHSQIPIIVLSHLAQDSDIAKARQLGANEYFVKVKVSINDLVEKVKTLVG